MKRCEDPADPNNGPRYLTGKLCIERCGRPAGTAWSPYWCQPCNAARMNRISAFLDAEVRHYETGVEPRK